MTAAQALAEARRLQAIMQRHGVRCVIDLKPDSGGRWFEPMAHRVAEMSHHIVSSRAHGTTRFYQLVRDGRSDVVGPLANGYGGWDMVYRVITLGRANHPGRGGPLTVAGKTIPRDNARPYTWGTEYEGGMNPADWTPAYREFMARANAAILEWLGLPLSAHIEHSTWAPGRKNDRLGYTAASGRAEITKALNTTPTSSEEDTMTPAQEKALNARLDAIEKSLTATVRDAQNRVAAHLGGVPTGTPLVDRDGNKADLASLRRAITLTHDQVIRQSGIVTALIKRLTDAGLDPAVVTKAVEAALADVEITLAVKG